MEHNSKLKATFYLENPAKESTCKVYTPENALLIKRHFKLVRAMESQKISNQIATDFRKLMGSIPNMPIPC